jgi:hypothetical protein
MYDFGRLSWGLFDNSRRSSRCPSLQLARKSIMQPTTTRAVVAVFPTDDGKFRYAVDTEGYGALQFFAEEKLAVHSAGQEYA